MGDKDRAQDLVQDALVRGYQAFAGGQFAEGSNARAWLLRILTNGFLNDERDRKLRAGLSLDAVTSGGEGGPEATHAPAHERPDAALLAGTLDEPLEQALAALPEGQRACVLLVDVEGLGYAEAAEALDIPVGTVRSRLATARLKLHSLLSKEARSRAKADG